MLNYKMISSNKWQKLRERMTELNIEESDIQEKFILGSGHGGQKIQKTASCVYLKHIPTGMEIKCQDSRLRDQNRYFARRRLCEKIDEKINAEKSEKQQAYEKIRRQKRKRSRRAKQKILNEKHQRATTKNMRKPPGEDS